MLKSNFQLDNNGYIKNMGSTSKIQGDFLPLLIDIVDSLKNLLSDSLLSIYVRGSISIGKAYLYSSDADIIVVTQRAIDLRELGSVLSTANRLIEGHPIVTEIDISVTTFQELQTGLSAGPHVHLTTQSAKLYGKDIASKLIKFKPNRELALYMYPNLANDFAELKRKFSGESQELSYLIQKRPLGFWCVWTAREILRSAQALVMATERVYERDLKLCLDNVVTIYPQFYPYLKQVYEWNLHPISDAQQVIRLLNMYTPEFLKLWCEKVVYTA